MLKISEPITRLKKKELWKINNSPAAASKTNTNPGAPVITVKLVEPPVKLNGIVDAAMTGVWRCRVVEIDYYIDFKADGTYDTWSSANQRKVKCYGRIDNGFFESYCEGGREKGRVPFKKNK